MLQYQERTPWDISNLNCTSEREKYTSIISNYISINSTIIPNHFFNDIWNSTFYMAKPSCQCIAKKQMDFSCQEMSEGPFNMSDIHRMVMLLTVLVRSVSKENKHTKRF